MVRYSICLTQIINQKNKNNGKIISKIRVMDASLLV